MTNGMKQVFAALVFPTALLAASAAAAGERSVTEEFRHEVGAATAVDQFVAATASVQHVARLDLPTLKRCVIEDGMEIVEEKEVAPGQLAWFMRQPGLDLKWAVLFFGVDGHTATNLELTALFAADEAADRTRVAEDFNRKVRWVRSYAVPDGRSAIVVESDVAPMSGSPDESAGVAAFIRGQWLGSLIAFRATGE